MASRASRVGRARRGCCTSLTLRVPVPSMGTVVVLLPTPSSWGEGYFPGRGARVWSRGRVSQGCCRTASGPFLGPEWTPMFPG